jgi:hypothetical protein
MSESDDNAKIQAIRERARAEKAAKKRAERKAEAQERREARRAARIEEYLRARGKSAVTAFLLALLFGPVGYLYASPLGGVILIIVAVGLVVSGGVQFVSLAWLFAAVSAPFLVSRFNDRVRANAEMMAGD